MTSDSTSIFELPTEPLNVDIQTPALSSSQKPPVLSLDESTINQIVNGLQQASATGITQLPSRDIPRSTESIVQDPQTQPNYIPSPPLPSTKQQASSFSQIDYIQGDDEMTSMYNNRQNRRTDSLDEMYSEIQIPLLLSVLYFLFQLPIFKKQLLKYFAVLFHKDGNYNIQGYLFTSILFGLLYYFLTKVMLYFNTF